MRNVKTVQNACLFPLVKEIIEQGQSARISVTGSSMYPFLRDTIDSVEMSKGDFDSLARGDIVLIRRYSGAYVMHRVYKKEKDCFYLVGDAQQQIEGPLFPDQIVAAVPSVWRKGKNISCSNPWWRVLSWIWLLLLPFRHYVFRAGRLIKRLLKKKTDSRGLRS